MSQVNQRAIRISKKQLVLLLCAGMLIFPVLIKSRVIPIPVNVMKDRTVIIWDYFTLDPTIDNFLANIYGRKEYTPVGSQIGDGGAPILAVLNDPTGIVGDNQGNLFIAERRNFRIRKIANGIISTWVGTGRRGYSGEGVTATFARLNRPEGLDLDQFGNLYVADSFNHRIRKISPEGKIETVAGVGMSGYTGDGGSAVLARLAAPMDVKVGPSGSLFILERDNHCIRRVESSGEITTWAGTGVPGFSGDGGVATNAMLNNPYGLTIDPEGNVYVADSENHRVRKISKEGVISTVAGMGSPGFSGDGGLAIDGQLNSPQSVLWTADHSLVIGDEHDHRVRKVDSSGKITTIAGTGNAGFSGDGGPAIQAEINDPEYLWEDSSGNLYIADGDNGRVRMVDADGIITTVAGRGNDR